MELSYLQKKNIYDDGYVVIPGVVPGVMVDAALQAINHSVGEGMDMKDIETMRSRSYCTEIQEMPVIADLLNKTPALELAVSALGRNIPPTGSGQIALRFPSLVNPPGPVGGHLDGMHSPHNGVPENTFTNFNMLAVVLLSDVPEPNSGNFAVFPGTHHKYERYFQEHGPEALFDGMPPIEMPEPVQVCGSAGDLVLCHYEVAHSAAPNISPNVRYAVIYRLSAEDHSNHMREVLTDIWMEWDGMRQIIEENSEPISA